MQPIDTVTQTAACIAAAAALAEQCRECAVAEPAASTARGGGYRKRDCIYKHFERWREFYVPFYLYHD